MWKKGEKMEKLKITLLHEMYLQNNILELLNIYI